MQHVEVVQEYAVPPETVFDRYTDHVSWQEWASLGRVTLARQGTPVPNGVGCVRVVTAAGIGTHEEVLSFERPRRMTYRYLKGPVPLRNHLGEVVFEPVGNGTRVIWRCRFDSAVPGLGPLLRWFITRVFRQVLAGLRRDLRAATQPARTTD